MNKYILILSLILFLSCTDKQYKKIVINNIDSAVKISETFYNINFNDGIYDNITIHLDLENDSTYTMVFWVNRESVYSDFINDKVITTTIPYNQWKGKDIKYDLEIIEYLNNK